MSSNWRLLIAPTARGSWNMAVDEAIRESTGSGYSLPTLRLYAWQPACLSLGYGQPLVEVDQSRLQERGWDLVRRSTGGRAVLHVDELTYSVTAPLQEPHVAGSVLESYNRLAPALVRALHLLGVAAEIQGTVRQSGKNPNPVCFEVPSSSEITCGGKKVIGSAQSRRKQGFLQHGSLPLSGDLRRITQVLAFPDEETRQLASVRLLTHATTLEGCLGREVTWDEAAQAMQAAFEQVLDLHFTLENLAPLETSRALELMDKKFALPDHGIDPS